MSLINDALVQAGRDDSSVPPPPGIVFRGESGLHSRHRTSHSGRFLVFAALIVFVSSLAMGRLWLRANSTHLNLPPLVRNLIGKPAVQPAALAKNIESCLRQAGSKTAAISAVSPVSSNVPVATAAPPAPPVPPTASNFIPRVLSIFGKFGSKGKSAPDDDSDYKLQGIVYCPGNSSAVINGKTAYVGEKIENARVRSIGPAKVVLLCSDGRTNILELHK